MKVVVDSNIFYSALIPRNSRIRRILLLDDTLSFYAPSFLLAELLQHRVRLVKASRLRLDEWNELIELLFARITFIDSTSVDTGTWIAAFRYCHRIDEKDTPFVAVALHLNAQLWTGDKKLVAGLQKNGYNQFFDVEVDAFTTEDAVQYVGQDLGIKGHHFIRDARVSSGNHLIVQYYFDYDEYHADRQEARVSRDMYEEYFGSGAMVEKLLITEPVRILRNVEKLQSVELIVPYKGRFHEVSLTREDVQKYFGVSLKELKSDSSAWTAFCDTFEYDAANRRAFLQSEFVRRID